MRSFKAFSDKAAILWATLTEACKFVGWFQSNKCEVWKKLMFSGLFKLGPSPSNKNCFISFNGNPLQTFYFILKALFVLKTLKCLSWLCWSCDKTAFVQKAKVSFKICNVTAWETKNNNTHIAQYHKKSRQSDN